MNLSLTEALKKHFGYSEFRPLQKEIIENILENKDVLVLMPTGGGKSICFQLPAIMKGGVSLVISPLISLMQDQVESLRRNGVSAAFYNSSQSNEEKERIRNAAENGEINLLYTAPESLFSGPDSFLLQIPYQMVVIDEAHCASIWGHDFRPEYQKIATFRKSLPNVPFASFTATADKITRKDISTHLGLKDNKAFISSFDRPNIFLSVAGQVAKKDKWDEIKRFILRKKGQSGIIYCLSRKETVELSTYLAKEKISVGAYHAGLESEHRTEIQQQFLRDDLQVIVATIAFGMGIDKSNVRWVIHNNLPKNLEGYYQEIGRAGRDGEPAQAILYYNMRDVKLLSDFARESSQKELQIEKLNRMLSYAETSTCRRRILLAYFSEDLRENCGNCDSCLNPSTFVDATRWAQMAISACIRVDQKASSNQLIDILRGAKTQEVFENKWNEVKTYGVGAQMSWKEWNHLMKEFKNQGVFEIAYDDNMHLKVSEYGYSIVKQNTVCMVSAYSEEKQTKEIEVKELSSTDLLFDRLKLVRKKLATQENIPPYYIFSDASLQDMAKKKPRNAQEFKLVSGVGESKMDKYAHEFIPIVLRFCEDHPEYATPSIKEKGVAKEKKTKVNTLDHTLSLYEQGMTVAEISEIRQLSETTVLSHLGELIKSDKINEYLTLISPVDIERVSTALKELSFSGQLKPIYEHLNEEISYGKIRIALSILEKEMTV